MVLFQIRGSPDDLDICMCPRNDYRCSLLYRQDGGAVIFEF